MFLEPEPYATIHDEPIRRRPCIYRPLPIGSALRQGHGVVAGLPNVEDVLQTEKQTDLAHRDLV